MVVVHLIPSHYGCVRLLIARSGPLVHLNTGDCLLALILLLVSQPMRCPHDFALPSDQLCPDHGYWAVSKSPTAIIACQINLSAYMLYHCKQVLGITLGKNVFKKVLELSLKKYFWHKDACTLTRYLWRGYMD